MRLVEISGDIPKPIIGDRCEEIRAVLEVFPGRILKCTKRYALIDTDNPKEVSYRLAMAHYVYEVIHGPGIEGELSGTYLVERVRIGGRRIEVKEALEIVKSLGASVDLKAKERTFVISTPDGIFVATRRLPTGRRFLYKRKPANRPVHDPPTLDPYLSRFLVNLSRVPPGERLLDPFCGFGSILLEAYDVGAKPIGIDMRKRALEGTMKNFEHFYHARPQLVLGDSTKGIIKGVKHVASDPPRGKMLRKGLDARYKFLEVTDARRISAVLGPYHDVGSPVYYGVLNEGTKKELRFVVYKNR